MALSSSPPTRCGRKIGCGALRSVAVALLITLGIGTPARAEFRVCNESASSAAVAIAQSNGLEWISQGWWAVDAKRCQVLLEGALKGRYYYLYAVGLADGSGWTGNRYFCTSNRSFTITGRKDCEKRGYRTAGFFEVDTQDALDYTHLLTEEEP